MTSTPDPYETLQVHPRADAAAIEAAYRRLRELYDPARIEGAADELLDLARAKRDTIEQAYAILGDEARRAAYDAEQEAQSPALRTENREPRTENHVQQSGSQFSVLGSSNEQLDYRPLPPARRQERPRGAAEPLLPAPVRAAGRAARPAARRLPAAPIALVGAVVLVIATSMLLTGGGSPPPPPPTPTTSPLDAFEASIPPAQAFAEQNRSDPQAWIDLGNLLYDSAQVVREQAPDSELYQQRLGRWLQATAAYSQALTLDPTNAAARADLGASACFYGAGTGDQSFVQQGSAEVRRAVAAAPDDARVLLSMGHCLVSQQPPQTDAAIAAWQRIIERNPSSPLVSQAQLLIARYSKK